MRWEANKVRGGLTKREAVKTRKAPQKGGAQNLR